MEAIVAALAEQQDELSGLLSELEGPDWQRLLGRVRGGFATVLTIKPAGSRKESIEQYVVGLGLKPIVG